MHIKYVLAMTLLFLASASFAQNKYQPKDSWPYIGQEFLPGSVYSLTGQLQAPGNLNICIIDGKLHYVQGSTIMEADMNQVYTAVVGDSEYINRMGRMLKVLAKTDYGYVLEDTYVDMDELNKVDIGYGVSSSTASSRSTSLMGVGLDGLQGINVLERFGREYDKISLQKDSGSKLPTRTKVYLFTKNVQVPATKRDVLSLSNISKSATSAFLKNNKIKWKDVSDLEKVVEFLYNNIN